MYATALTQSDRQKIHPELIARIADEQNSEMKKLFTSFDQANTVPRYVGRIIPNANGTANMSA
jgi:hypothetical protein